MLITLVPVFAMGPSTIVMSPMGPPVRGEDLRSINETAELTSIPVTEERIHLADVRQNVTDHEERKYHGMSWLLIATYNAVCMSRACITLMYI